MSIGRILFLAIFLFSASTVLATSSLFEKMTLDSIKELKQQTQVIDQFNQPNQLKEQYRQDLLGVLSRFSGKNISYQEFEKQLLSLTVPVDYQELHFSLVASVTDLVNNQPEDINLSKNRLESLTKAYSWLAANLSLIIANNF